MSMAEGVELRETYIKQFEKMANDYCQNEYINTINRGNRIRKERDDHADGTCEQYCDYEYDKYDELVLTECGACSDKAISNKVNYEHDENGNVLIERTEDIDTVNGLVKSVLVLEYSYECW